MFSEIALHGKIFFQRIDGDLNNLKGGRTVQSGFGKFEVSVSAVVHGPLSRPNGRSISIINFLQPLFVWDLSRLLDDHV